MGNETVKHEFSRILKYATTLLYRYFIMTMKKEGKNTSLNPILHYIRVHCKRVLVYCVLAYCTQ